MKLKAIFVFMAVLAICVGSSFATPGWAGLQWPPAGSTFGDNDDIQVWVNIWESGCTEGEGQCAYFDEVWLDYKKATDPTYTSVLMAYNPGNTGSNDEYGHLITAAETEGGVDMECTGRVHDTRDDSWTNFSWVYHIALGGSSQDVVVTFRADMNCVPPDWYANGVYFTGDFPDPYPDWQCGNIASAMTDGDLDGIWEGSWTFPAGSIVGNYSYKFTRVDGNSNCEWLPGDNLVFTLDDSSPTQVLDPVPWIIYPGAPGAISGPGSYCVTLDCYNELWVMLETSYDPPIIENLMVEYGCDPELTNCDDPACFPGYGNVAWDIRQGGDMNWYLVMRIDDEDGMYGCFCITIDAILPVELAGFDAIAGDNEVTLRWTTGSETDNDYFSIVRDGAEMTRIDASGNATGHDYVWVDSNVRNGVTYNYTLINVDVDGSQTVLETAAVTPNRNNANVMEYSLSQNYPNPFNPSTSIAYSLEEAGLVNITVFDITGREVAMLVNGEMAAGSHAVEFDAAGLPSGIYMYRMEAGDFSAVQKMVLMK
ncbi:T9SS type A sorting domain-containing protein [bacterium]|nr:T9SS type A sorting domain-containing protein [bacterium]MBU1638490.1 T9SS type A sorting domain-containing protein [bacterium]